MTIKITAFASITFNISALVHAERATDLDDLAAVRSLETRDPVFQKRAVELEAATLGSAI